MLATVTVNTTSDVNDGTTSSITALLTAPGADGVISLREAIIAANNSANVDGPDADSNPDPDLIAFNIPGGGVKTITPTTALPTVTQAVVIDGYTQPGASPNTLVVGSDAVLLIELVGGVGPGNGLVISAANSTVRGLVINRFGSAAIQLQSGGNTIEGNWLGIEEDGNTRRANEYDVFVSNPPTSANNLIGGTTPGSRNVMAGTAGGNAGIMLFPGGGAATIQGNYIGMNAQGTDGIGASGRIYLGTPGNLVGGTAPGAGNVISGRAMEVYAASNTVQGNTFGLNASGTATLANNSNGIFIASHSIPTDNNLIGGTTSAARNVFATSGTAIDIANSSGGNVGNRIQGNYFGMNTAGLAPTGQVNPSISGTAIRLNGGMNNLIGGTTAGASNVIANYGNGYGIEVLGSNNTIQGNLIGTDPAGTVAIPNTGGIYVGNYVSNNLIGGSAPGAGNVIAGNKGDGILIGPAGTFNTIQGNLIGLAADGISPLGNGTAGGSPALRNGIRVEGADNIIGGAGVGEGNKIAFNFGSGVLLPFTNVVGGSGLRNSVLGNSIYSNGGLGIDFFGNGVTANDLNDPDSGQPNDLQNFPVITSATTAGSTTTITGTLNSIANSTFRVELFASAAMDGSGFGEGQTYLGYVTVTTNASSTGSFSYTPTVTVPVGQFITGTATSSNGSTSEFSAGRVVVAPPNQPPVITSNGGGDSASISVPENTTAVSTVTASDPDAGTTIVYSISGGADAARFAINSATGVLTFGTAPNFEAPTDIGADNIYEVSVTASDGSLTDTQALTVTVTNANELPVITSNGGGDSASVAVPENTTTVTTVSAADADAGTTVVYSISGGADAARFAINSATGALTFGTAPNFEAPTDIGADNIYEVSVTASDGSLTDTQALTVTVTNANELPVITSNGGGDSASVAVPENTTTVTTVSAADADAGTTVVYSISGGADAARFAINSATGVLTFGTAPNFEAPTDIGADNIYEVSVTASDGSLTDTQALTVTVTNANEPPVITSNGGGDSASVAVPENTTTVTTVSAADADAGTTIVYSISGGADAARFAINSATGALTFGAAPDFEAPTDIGADNIYEVSVTASDGSLTDTQALTVTVTNANEPPVITSNGGGDSASVAVPENTTTVTTVSAVDADAGTTIVYSISGGADAARFAINSATGVLTFGAAPNFEAPTDIGADNIYEVSVTVSDGSLTDTQALTVTVTNANEPPVITSNGGGDSANVAVPENTTTVTTVSAADADAGTTIVYSISGGADAARFAINSATGALTFGTAPNFEAPTDIGADNIYEVSVTASDGSLTDTQALTVTVTNANEPPVITSNGGGDSASVAVPENTTTVTTVSAVDADAGTTIVYSISGGADAARFAINSATGALIFGTAPNFEAATDIGADNIYEVSVTASDGSLTDTQALTVTVTNANEPPVITSNGGGDSANVAVPENTTTVTTVSAADADAGTTIVYSISGGADAARFAINSATGALTFGTAPNFEAPTDIGADNIYEVSVTASDGSLTDTQALTVTVTNANEPPVITSNGGGDSASVAVPENTTTVTTVSAADADAGTTIVYSISGGADAARFAINSATGALTFGTAPNFEAPTDIGADNIYEVSVRASDGNLTDTQALTVTVTDVAEAGYTISGQVFRDVTGNGKSADDSPWNLNPVTLKLYRDVNGDGVYQTSDMLIGSTVSSSGGVYSFTTATTGKFIVKEVVPSDFVRTFPVLSDYVAVNLTATSPTSSGHDWYNAETCDDCALSNVTYIVNHGGVLTTVTDLRGNTYEGDIVTVNFTVAATRQFTLVSYNAPGPAWNPNTASQQTVFDFHTATFAPGSHSLTVSIPKNFYQIDFVCGAYIDRLGPPGSNIFYSAQNRLISADNSGVNALGAPAIDLALSTSVNNASPLLGSNVVITVAVSNAAGWSTATGVRVKNVLPAGLTFVSSSATQGTYNRSSGEWNLVNPLNSGATATMTITATVTTAGEKRNAAQVTAAGTPDIDSTPNNDPSPSTPHNEDDDDSVSIVPQVWTKYFVVNDASSGSARERTFEYGADGASVENYQLSSGNTAPRGAASTAAGNKVWVIDASKMVYVYDAGGTLLGSWLAGGLASYAAPEGIATNGTDIWIVDAQQDKVFKYANAVSRVSGSQNATSSFALNSSNRNPKDIVASNTHLWVVEDSSTDKVFKYTLAGLFVGGWTMTGGGGSPTGITLDPANVNHLWVVDKNTDRVYQFNAAASRGTGSQAAASSFPLASGNTSPEGIADPPPALASTIAASTQVTANNPARVANVRAFDLALLAVLGEFDDLLGHGRKKKLSR